MLFLPSELFEVGGVVPQIDLSADEQEGHTGAVVADFGHPLFWAMSALEKLDGRGKVVKDM